SSRTFKFEWDAPSSTITFPSYARTKNLASISGTAADIAPGEVATVEVRLSNPDGVWWDHGDGTWGIPSNEGDTAWFVATEDPDWSDWFSSGTTPTTFYAFLDDLQSGSTYQFNSKAQDEAGTWSVIFSTETTVYDPEAPETGLTFPPMGPNARANNLTFISGTLVDKPDSNPGTVPTVYVRLMRLSDGWYWKPTINNWLGSEWTITDPPTTINVYESSWTISDTAPLPTAAGGKLTSGASYYVVSSGFDNTNGGGINGNQESFYNTRGSTFTYDDIKSTATIWDPGSTIVNNLPTISGTSNDDTDTVSLVEISIQEMAPGNTFYWNFTSEDFSLDYSSFGAVVSTGLWTYTDSLGSDMNAVLTSGRKYIVTSRASDLAGNVQDEFELGTSSVNFTYDTKAPNMGIAEPADTENYSELTTISGTIDDLQDDPANAPYTSNEIRVFVSIKDTTLNKYWNADWVVAASSWVVQTASQSITVTNGSPKWWDSSTIDLPIWASDHTYDVIVYGEDNAGNIAVAFTTSTFTFDASGPITSINNPVFDGEGFNGSTKQLTELSGTVYDVSSDVAEIWISMCLDDNKDGDCEDGSDVYWDWAAQDFGTETVVTTNVFTSITPSLPASVTEVAPATWSVTFNPADWTSPEKYVLEVYAIDAVTLANGGENIEASTKTRSFSIDSDAPSSVITTISSAVFYSALIAQITGTVADPGDFSNIGAVELQIKDFGNDFEEGSNPNADTYWDGSDFDSTASTWVVVTPPGGPSGTWTYDTTGVLWKSTGRYRVSVRAKDSADNQEADELGQIFMIDRGSPTAVVTYPVDEDGYVGFPVLQGTASDGLGATDAGVVYSTHVQIAIQQLGGINDRLCWSGTNWIGAGNHPYWLNAAFTGHSSGTWVYSSVPDAGDTESGVEYLILSRARDNAKPYPGNTQIDFISGSSSVTFSVDNSSASATISFPTATVRNVMTSISGDAADDFSGAEDVLLSLILYNGTSYYWTASSWTTTVTDIAVAVDNQGELNSTWSYNALPSTWTPSGQEYTIEVNGRDVTGNTQVDASSVTWIYDTDGPGMGISVPDQDNNYYSPVNALPSIDGTAEDAAGAVTNEYTNVGEVFVRLRMFQTGAQQATDLYWTGSSWTSTSDTWISSSGWNQSSASWSIPEPDTCPVSGIEDTDWCDNRLYWAQARSRDLTLPSGNLSNWTTRQFYYDSYSPTIGIKDPNFAYEDTLGEITGTATDDATKPNRSDIYKVYVAIQINPDSSGNWWEVPAQTFTEPNGAVDGCDEPSDSCYIEVSTGTGGQINWIFTSTPTWDDGQKYRIKAIAEDNAGNYSTPASIDFTYDESGPPSVDITLPADGGRYNSVTSMAGSASDEWGVVSASVSIKESPIGAGGGNMFWDADAATFTSTSELWYEVQLAGAPPDYTWTFSGADFPAAGKFVDDRRYMYRAKVLDVEGKENTPGAYYQFTFDTTKPTSTVRVPSNNAYLNSLDSITGTAIDFTAFGSTIAAVEIYIRQNFSPNDYWTGSNWGNLTWLPTTWDGSSWEITSGLPGAGSPGLEDGKEYVIRVHAEDMATNLQDSLSDPVSFIYDKTGPVLKLGIPENDADVPGTKIYSSITQITGTAQDVSNVTQVVYMIKDKNNNYWDQAGDDFPNSTERWYVVGDSESTNAQFTWSTGSVPTWPAGNTVVYAKAQDLAGNYSAVFTTSTFTFDNDIPVSIVTNVAEGSIISSLQTISGTAVDASSMDDIKIRVRDLNHSTTQWFTPSGTCWDTVDTFLTSVDNFSGAAIPSQWVWDYTNANCLGSTAAWNTGHTYQITTRATDKSVPAKVEVAYSTRTFTFDNSPPSVLMTTPIAGGFVHVDQLGEIAGTAIDSPAGVNSNVGAPSDWGIKLSIYEVETSSWYSGTVFGGGTEADNPLFPGATTWAYSIAQPATKFKDGHHYRIRALGRDILGNEEDPGKTQYEIMVDTTPPDAEISYPASAGSTEDDNSWNIAGTATDPEADPDPDGGANNFSDLAGVGSIEIQVFRDEDLNGNPTQAIDYYWDHSVSTWVLVGTPPTSNEKWFNPTDYTPGAIKSWQYSGLRCADDAERLAETCWVSGKWYRIRTRVTDQAGNAETVAANQGFSVRVAVETPHHFALIPASYGPYAAGTENLVTVEAHDSLHRVAAAYALSGAKTVRFMATDTSPAAPEVPGAGGGLPSDQVFAAGADDEGVLADVGGMILRKAGTRNIEVFEVNASSLPTSTIAHPLSIEITTDTVDRVLVLDASDQAYRPGCNGVNANCETAYGREGSLEVKTAGVGFNVRVMATDKYYNIVSDSEPFVSLTTSDPNADDADFATQQITNGDASFNLTLKSKGGSVTNPSPPPSARTISATGAGTAGAWNTTDDITVNANPASATQRLLMLLPGESSDPGNTSPSAAGKSGNTNTNNVAGTTFTVTVFATDEYYNPYDPGQIGGGGSQTPAIDAWVNTFTDPYDVHPDTITLTDGTTTFDVNIYVSSDHWVTASDGAGNYVDYDSSVDNSTTVWVNVDTTSVKMQILVPGETAMPGKPPYNSNPTTGGKDSDPDDFTAGATYYITVNIVDRYFNLVTENLGVGMPNATVSTEDDNDQEPGPLLLVDGTTQFPVRMITANYSGLTPQIYVSTGGTQRDETPDLTVVPASSKKLLILISPPGEESHDPGTNDGKDGSINNKTAGSEFTVRVHSVDEFFNIKSDNPTVEIDTNDQYDPDGTGVEAPASKYGPYPLSNGSYDFKVTPRVSGNNVLEIIAKADDYTVEYATTSNIDVNDGTYSKLLPVLAGLGETFDPGSATGKTGTINDAVAGARIAVDVYAVDNSNNQVDVDTPSVVLAVDGGLGYDVSADSKTITGGIAQFNSSTGPVIYNAGTSFRIEADNIDSGTPPDAYSSYFDVVPAAVKQIIIAVDPQTLSPGEWDVAPNPAPTYNGSGGKSNSPANDLTAGVPFEVDVYATDLYYNQVDTNPVVTITPDAEAGEDTGSLAISRQMISGTTTFWPVFKAAASNRTLTPSVTSYAITFMRVSSDFTIAANDASRLLLLVQGETLSQGSATGKSGSPDGVTGTAGIQPFYAGVDFGIKGYLTDDYFNPTVLIGAGNVDDFNVKVRSTDGNDSDVPGSILAFSGTIGPKYEFPANNSGTGSCGNVGDWECYTLKTATGPAPLGWVLRISTDSGAINYAEDSSSNLSVIADTASATGRIQVLLPGEEAAPGTSTGKRSGFDPTARTAGESFSISLRTTDDSWNIISDNSVQVVLSAPNDPYVEGLGGKVISGGEIQVNNIVFKKEQSNVVIISSFISGGNWSINYASANATPATKPFTVQENLPTRLQILVDGQSPDPGTPTGRTGTINSNLKAGVPFDVTVRATDDNWNLIESTSNIDVVLSSNYESPYVDLGSTQTLITGATVFSVRIYKAMDSAANPVSHIISVTTATPSVLASTNTLSFTVDANDFTKLQVLLPGETYDP
ncbi:hypothetical protein ACFL6Y_10110, partial [Elusimicrobiota bacterium]